MTNTAVARSRNQARYYGSGRDWETPPSVFEPLDAEFHFTLDPCCRPETAKCARYFTEQDDGLAQSWAGERVFMNPPYGREIAAWTRKARQEAERGVLVVGLLPASTDLGWWHEDVLAAGAEVRFIRGRVRFLARAGGQRIGRIERNGLFPEYEVKVSADGTAWANAMFPNVIVIWRPKP
jgi:site-specific DNA-methyltransferase (adenine-specific)